MSGRETLLAELEAQRREQAESPPEVLEADLWPGADVGGYDPYDNPGHAKPLDTDRLAKTVSRQKRR